MHAKIKHQSPPVSVIIAMRNAQTTILHTLESLLTQKYPVKEIFVVDNKSEDRSVALVKQFVKEHKANIRLFERKANKGLVSSFNLGAKYATSDYLIFMHSDCSIPTSLELTKLVAPLLQSDNAVAAYPTIILPQDVWNKYNFWEKCLLCRTVGKEHHSLSAKFDAFRRSAFKKIGGFDEINYGQDMSVGGEDADVHIRLKKVGNVIATEAKVLHLHYLANDYGLRDWIRNRKLLARTYGRHVRTHFRDLSLGAVLFVVKPFLALLPFLPGFQTIGLLLLAVYSILYTGNMYTTPSANRDPRILLLPFINIFLVYYEVFWMLEAFSYVKKSNT